MFLRQVVLYLVIILVAPVSFAAEPYFDAKTIPPTLLSMPYRNNSPEQQKELEYIVSIQKNADKTEIDQAAKEHDMSPEMIMESVTGIDRKDFPAVYNLLDRVGETSREITDNVKEYWNTDRPYLVDKRVKPLIKANKNHSYPSGHTSGSYVWAQVSTMLLPEYRNVFYDKADNIAWHRVLVGMHFPHDLEGGRELAFLTLGSLLHNQQFLADLQKAKDELNEKYKQ